MLVRPDDNSGPRVLLRFQSQGVHHGKTSLPSSGHQQVCKSRFCQKPMRNAGFSWLSQKLSVEQVPMGGHFRGSVCSNSGPLDISLASHINMGSGRFFGVQFFLEVAISDTHKKDQLRTTEIHFLVQEGELLTSALASSHGLESAS